MRRITASSAKLGKISLIVVLCVVDRLISQTAHVNIQSSVGTFHFCNV